MRYEKNISPLEVNVNSSRPQRSKFNYLAIFTLVSCAAVQAYNYYYLVSKPSLQERIELHTQILNGLAPSPYLYRDLIPFVAEVFYRLGSQIVSPSLAFSAVYFILDFAGISLIMIGLYYYLSHWFTKELSLAGSLFCAAVIGITAHHHYFQPWSFWETGFFILSLLLIRQKRMILLVLIIALATLNRETALIIPFVYLVTTQDIKGMIQGRTRLDWQKISWFGACLATWVVIYLGLRILRGSTAHVETLQEILMSNLDPKNWWKIVLNILLFQGFFWVWAVMGYRTAPQFIRRTVWVVPLFTVLFVAWAYWIEVRVLMPLYAISIPLGISYLSSKLELKQ